MSRKTDKESPVGSSDGYTATWQPGEKRERPYTKEEKAQIREYCEQRGLDPNWIEGYNEKEE